MRFHGVRHPGNLGQQRSRRHFCPGWRSRRKVSVSASSAWRPCCSSTARCCAWICPGFRRSEDLSRRGAAGGADPDEVVRILSFLEGEHRLFAQLLYGTGMPDQ
ncbi:hypothetical protein [Klebsiella pneumoniae]|uniref:hypothetical protein n=1 Tax=Klebsiella pneumoniae TaxID=573 RepID=UPI003D998BC9